MKQYSMGYIPDGNRRWAIERGLPPKEGHERGAAVLRDVVDFFITKPEIKEFSVYIMSEENLARSSLELDWLNAVYRKGLEDLLDKKELHKLQCTVNMVSTKPSYVSADLKDLFKQLKSETKIYSNKMLNILIIYTGKSEILQAASTPLNRVKNLFFGLKEKDIERSLQIKNPCDFIIRTGYEEAPREAKSGFLIWQSAYSEHYHLNKNFPDTTMEDCEDIYQWMLNSRRMFGT